MQSMALLKTIFSLEPTYMSVKSIPVFAIWSKEIVKILKKPPTSII
jgi:hypothetical protein